MAHLGPDLPSAKRDPFEGSPQRAQRIHEGHEGACTSLRARCALCESFVFFVMNQPAVEPEAFKPGFAGRGR
jgi:hypothetical protein